MRRAIYIDPASISTGWALFEGGQLQASGSIVADKKLQVHDRLRVIHEAYKEIAARFTDIHELHVELLPRSVHHFTAWSVGAIVSAFVGPVLCPGVPISSWQKAVAWKTDRAPLQGFEGKLATEDELAAVSMGLYWEKIKRSE